ncbi:F-box protein CPR1-like [Euphorbia lathyris]|uniref:F-box protein CPR1-like n=1 Tax=Euphorbia lathyris TaxID=212925 RepID=UPI0033132C2F
MEVPQPQLSGSEGPGLGPLSICIGTVGKWLSLNAIYGMSLDIWVMKEYGVKESWTKLVSVTPNLISTFKCVRRSPFSKNNGDEFLIGLQGTDLVWYNLKKKTTKIMEISDVNTPIYTAESFHGSLVPLKQTNTKKANSKKASSKGKKNKKNRDEFLSTGFKLKL